ncbi:hypothetical protein [Haladaptatus sp. DFWS20]
MASRSPQVKLTTLVVVVVFVIPSGVCVADELGTAASKRGGAKRL